MEIGKKQKKIIKICNFFFKNSKNIKNIKGSSSLTYFALWGQSPGFERIKLKLYGAKYLISFILKIVKDIFLISALSNFKIYKNKKLKKINYKKVIVSNATLSDFNQEGIYTDRYFQINSKTLNDYLFFVIYQSEKLPKKINNNIVILFNNNKFKYDIFFLIKYIFIKLINCKLSFTIFFHKTSTYYRTSEIITKLIKNEINFKNIEKIIVPYEGQPYQHAIFQEAKRLNKKILTFGYDHSAPHSLPLHLIHRNVSPDILFVNGSSQIEHLNKFLNWPKKKLRLVPSARYPKNLDLGFKNKIFLPYEIFDIDTISEEFEKIVINSPLKRFNLLEVKNHPLMPNSKKHKLMKMKLDGIIKKHKKRFAKLKKKNNDTAIFIGPTTGVIVALEKNIKVIHICFNPIFDSYSEVLWPNLKVKKIANNSFKYNIKKLNSFVKFSNNKNCFKKYYEI